MGPPTDEELMVRVSSESDESAFRELFDRYWGRVVGYLRSLSMRSFDAEDLAQETFLNLVRYRHTYTEGRPFVPWLYQIARNLLRRSGRSSGRRPDRFHVDLSDEGLAPPPMQRVAEQPAERTLDRERSDFVSVALAGLEEGVRQVVALRVQEGWTFGEIGQALGLAEDTTRKRFKSGIKKLRKRLRRQGLA